MKQTKHLALLIIMIKAILTLGSNVISINFNVTKRNQRMRIKLNSASINLLVELECLCYFRHRIPIDQWWMQIRPLLRVMAHYFDAKSIYHTDVSS